VIVADLVSILIPSYKPRFFREVFDAALAQPWSEVEIVVFDDCPTGNIREICDRHADRVTYLGNPNPGRPGHNNTRHLGQISRGRYVKFVFEDDPLHPDCVARMGGALERTGAHLTFSPRDEIDDAGNRLPDEELRLDDQIDQPMEEVLREMRRDIKGGTGPCQLRMTLTRLLPE
jgi:glycosyltransferase involved in cell wall biosynthesis